MTELKTLEEIQESSPYHNTENYLVNELRAEAIKWIKELEINRTNYPNGLKIKDFEFVEGDKYENEEDTITPAQKILKHIFNINEDELK